MEITIVTAFFDIGRGNWTRDVQKNGHSLPHYLERSAETYIDRFSTLCNLDNELVVYTTANYAGRLQKIREDLGKGDKTKVIIVDYPSQFQDRYDMISSIMQTDEFINQINPNQRMNPEYWSPDYVLVTNLKPYFVNDAIQKGYVTNETAAWIDFGYCRTPSSLGNKTKWEYDFDKTKIHFFNCLPVDIQKANESIYDAVTNNSVYIFGAAVVAHKDHWESLSTAMEGGLNLLSQHNLVDDDQGVFLVCYYSEPSKFELHSIDYSDPFIVFRDYNN